MPSYSIYNQERALIAFQIPGHTGEYVNATKFTDIETAEYAKTLLEEMYQSQTFTIVEVIEA